MNLRELGEDRLLQRLLPDLPRNRQVISGAGDDCAVVRFADSEKLLLLKTDCVVEGVHFTPDARASAVGWKAMARPLSDFAAMSGLPRFALVTLIAQPSTSSRWMTELYRGLAKAARMFDVAIVGGETSRTDGPLAISVSITGEVETDRWVSRTGGEVGDELFVTGELGGSIRGKHLRFIPRIQEARWLTGRFRIRAMMDLSDGLGADLPRLARASGVGFEVDESAVPRSRGCSTNQAISDGEDYELLFAVAPAEAAALQTRWCRKFPKLRLTRIGRLIRTSKVGGRKLLRGYVHFQ
jgi:thiamine-monophosphate kinase